MRTTTALSARMRQILANLHPPTPLTTKEGQALLNVLQTSFKRQLDAHHPHPLQSGSKSCEHNDIPLVRESASSQATSSYFGSIFAHPTLASAEETCSKQDVFLKFDHLVVQPRLDAGMLASLIKSYTKGLKSSGKVQNGPQFGGRLSTWLHATDSSTREAFFLNHSTLKVSLDMLAVENNEVVLWQWLRMVYEREAIQADLKSMQWLDVEDQLVSATMRLAIHRNDLNDAAQQLTQACQYRIDSGRTHHDHPIPMTSSAKRLASSIIYHRHQHGITEDLFKEILTSLPGWSSGPETSFELCAVYNPHQPLAEMLYMRLKDSQQANLLVGRQSKAGKVSRKVVMTAILDASKLSLEQGKKWQASFLLNFAIDNYPDYLPPREVDEVEPQLEMTLQFAPG